ncbi:unnamed protein product [Prunus armeniaca]
MVETRLMKLPLYHTPTGQCRILLLVISFLVVQGFNLSTSDDARWDKRGHMTTWDVGNQAVDSTDDLLCARCLMKVPCGLALRCSLNFYQTHLLCSSSTMT